jgi:nicotinate-nucleotide adenylyltransferase
MDATLASLRRDRPVVFFGGTFDPPHIGHLVVADDLYTALRPSAVIFAPAATAPHKIGEPHAPAPARGEMARLACGDDERFVPWMGELERGGVSYTADTVDFLRAEGFTSVVVAVGADNLAAITTWRDWRRLTAEARVVVLTRPGFALGPTVELAGRVETLAVTAMPVSSTMVRERVRAGKPYRYLVPPAVYRYIAGERLYR